MGWSSLLETPEEKKEFYEEVRGYVKSSPLHACIVEHAYDIIPEADLEKKVIACRKGCGQSYSKKEYNDALFFLRDKSVIDKAMIHGVDGWHYEAAPFTKYVTRNLKPDQKRACHI